jgi:hypothetical protein
MFIIILVRTECKKLELSGFAAKRHLRMGNRPPARDPSTLYNSVPVPEGKTRICVAVSGSSLSDFRFHSIELQVNCHSQHFVFPLGD